MASRFRKCENCKVNIPVEDVRVTGKCTVCGSVMAIADENEEEAQKAAVAVKKQVKRKRWVTLVSKRGRTYYHNSETGEDTWTKPVDLDAEAVDDPFVPFKNDAVKNALMREQVKQEATKMGLPMDVIASMQQAQVQAEAQDDPLAMLQRPKPTASASPVQAPPSSSSSEDAKEERKDSAASATDKQEEHGNGSSCLLM